VSMDTVLENGWRITSREWESVVRRFWPKVDVRGPHECWEWAGKRLATGYGQMFVREFGNREDGTRVQHHALATRVSYCIANGDIPPGLLICHRCDNPSCVNPAHLELGTYRYNAQDMIRKGRASWQRKRANELRAANGDSFPPDVEPLDDEILIYVPQYREAI
jgi:hypothetical protein